MPYTRERLGELLLRAGVISDSQLEYALRVQGASGGKIGEVLVRELFVTEDQIAAALADQKGLEHVNLAATAIDRQAALMLPLRMVRRRQVIPIAVTADRLTLAMADPLDVEAVDETELTTGLKVDVVVAAASQVRYAIEKYVAGADAIQELEHDEAAAPAEGVEASEADVPVVRIVNQFIKEAVIERASDIHVEPQAKDVRIRYRIDGVLREAVTLPKSSQAELLSRLKVMAEMDITERRRPQDGRIAVKVDDKALDLRVATLPTPYGEAVTIRILDSEVAFHDIEDVGLGESDLKVVRKMLSHPFGAIFVSGPTGSGKSTTLYALLNEINDPGRKIVTVEDPIEYRMGGITQVAVNSRVGLTFAAGLRTILRSDPDVVMVGEVRDPETAEIAVRAALTGHLVLTSIHTNDAPSALTRLNDMGVPPYITSSAIVGAIAQRLARKLCVHCKRMADVPRGTLLAAGFSVEEVADLVVYEAVGCAECGKTGYRGRIGLFEVMEFDTHIARLFLREAAVDEMRQAALDQGMRPLRRDALDKVKAGLTSLQEIDRVVV